MAASGPAPDRRLVPPERARKDAHDRRRTVECLLDRLSRSGNPEELLSGQGARRFIAVTGDARLMVDPEKIAEAERRDGLADIITSLRDATVVEARDAIVARVLSHCHGLRQVEESFRITGHDLRVRPIRHLTTTHSRFERIDPATQPVMHAGLHQFRAETISWFRDAVSGEGRTRSSLARDLCALEGWTGDRGEPCLGSARKALPVLARKLGLELPAAQAASGRGRRADERKADCPDLSLRCRLAEPDVVMPEPVSGDTARQSS